VPKGFKIYTNENVYGFNDAAIKLILSEGVEKIVFPYENDFENLAAGRYRGGIVPVYFYPELFYSRMPVKTGEGLFKNDNNKNFRTIVKDGITIIVPEHPVSFLQYKNQLEKEGFRDYLIDVSYDNPSKNLIKKLKNRLQFSEQVQPSTNFNFKAGMK
jgi:putative protease